MLRRGEAHIWVHYSCAHGTPPWHPLHHDFGRPTILQRHATPWPVRISLPDQLALRTVHIANLEYARSTKLIRMEGLVLSTRRTVEASDQSTEDTGGATHATPQTEQPTSSPTGYIVSSAEPALNCDMKNSLPLLSAVELVE